ncbi:MAG: porin family protein [Bacteroidales bacterium]|jgi:hypothetical protein|nr:porin family protein [Bacteroidales bacterium]
MKKTLFVFFLFLFAGKLSGQDTIVIITDSDTLSYQEIEYQPFRIGLNIGGGYRFGKSYETGNSGFDHLADGTKIGFIFGAEATYFFFNNLGLGLRYNYFGYSNNEESNTLNFKTSYIGPSLYGRIKLGNPNMFLVPSVGAGYMRERQSSTYDSQSIDIKGNTIGMMASVSFDFKISNGAIISIEAAYMGGSLSKWKEKNGGNFTLPDNQKEGLSRIDLKIGIKLLP